MKQQINLYQPIFRKQKIIFSAVAMVQITAFLAVVLAGIYSYHVWKLQPFRAELARTDARLEQLGDQIEVLARQLPPASGGRLLENEIARLTRELEQKNRLKNELSGGSFGNLDGFSGHLIGLSRSHVPGSWLTGITIGGGGRQLTINGASINPELVPIYLQRLAEEPVFDDSHFSRVELTRSVQAPDQITFNVGTGG